MIASLLIFISLLVSASLVYGDVGIITAITKDTDSVPPQSELDFQAA